MTNEKENVAAVQQEEIIQPHEDLKSSESEKSEKTSEETISDKEYNFRRLREKNKQLEQELELLKRVRQENYNSQQENSSIEDINLAPDDIPEWRHVDKRIKELEKYIKQKEAASIPDRLQAKFKDFDQVVSEENVEKLRLQEPELFASISSGNDLYQKGIAAYKSIKAHGIYKEQYKEEKDFVQQSSSRPISSQSIKGQGALHEANIFAKGLTKEVKDKLYKEMIESMKGV